MQLTWRLILVMIITIGREVLHRVLDGQDWAQDVGLAERITLTTSCLSK
jgi:hypothetical protein